MAVGNMMYRLMLHPVQELSPANVLENMRNLTVAHAE